MYLRRGFVDLSAIASLHSARPRVPSGARAVACADLSEAQMLGEGEGLELMGVFFTFMIGLGIMVVLGKWWEA